MLCNKKKYILQAGFFLSGCSVIHAMSDDQDMRKMGRLASSFPLTYASVELRLQNRS